MKKDLIKNCGMKQICKMVFAALVLSFVCLTSISCSNAAASVPMYAGNGTYAYSKTVEFSDFDRKIFKRTYKNKYGKETYTEIYVTTKIKNESTEEAKLGDIRVYGTIPNGMAGGDVIGTIAAPGESKTYDCGGSKVTIKNNIDKDNTLDVTFH